MTDLVIRDTVEADWLHVIGFMAGLQDFERGLEPHRRPGAEMAAGHYQVMRDWVAKHPASSDIVAELEGNLVGWALAGVEHPTGFLVPESSHPTGRISDIWVEPGCRGRGVASALIGAVEARFAEHGISRVELAAVAGNERAIALYRRLGYAPYELTLGKTI
ncbi:GNAT family N-acetyltransferase [Rhodobacteraceae bacterium NNCM2]|nr:GNAT family N-acetyltransferase [Coraliihabitans acroporae]